MKGIKEKMNEEENEAIEWLKNVNEHWLPRSLFTGNQTVTLLNLIKKQQTKIDKALKFIEENRYADDNGCGYEWECMEDIDELVLILKGEK